MLRLPDGVGRPVSNSLPSWTCSTYPRSRIAIHCPAVRCRQVFAPRYFPPGISAMQRPTPRIRRRHFGIVLNKPCVGSVAVRKDFEMITVADYLAGIDIDPDCCHQCPAPSVAATPFSPGLAPPPHGIGGGRSSANDGGLGTGGISAS